MNAPRERNGDTAQGTIATVRSGMPFKAQGKRLVRVDDLGPDQVVEVDTADHGTLAVGIADGRPFATGNVCRHQAAKLGRGQVRDGCLECPWHRARYDVRTGVMVEGPKGRIFGFKPYSRTVRAVANAGFKLTSHPVVVRDGAIWLA